MKTEIRAEGRQTQFLYLPGIVLSALVIASALGQTASTGNIAAPPPPGVEVMIRPEPDKATIGDPIRIELEVSLPKGYAVRLPQLGSQVGDFSILEVFPGPVVPDLKQPGQPSASKSAGKSSSPEISHHHARIVAAVYKTGEITFPALELSLRDPEGKETILPTPPVKILIQSLLSEKDQSLNDLKKQADIPQPARWLLWISLALLALILAALGLWYYRRRTRASNKILPGPQLDPLQLAEAELRDLMGRGLLEKRLVKQFYVALSEIVKKILEGGYGISAAEKTTDEILEALDANGAGPVSREELDRISSFLCACDLVKFAKCVPAQSENEEAVQSAYRLLGFCKSRRAASVAQTALQPGGGA